MSKPTFIWDPLQPDAGTRSEASGRLVGRSPVPLGVMPHKSSVRRKADHVTVARGHRPPGRLAATTLRGTPSGCGSADGPGHRRRSRPTRRATPRQEAWRPGSAGASGPARPRSYRRPTRDEVGMAEDPLVEGDRRLDALDDQFVEGRAASSPGPRAGSVRGRSACRGASRNRAARYSRPGYASPSGRRVRPGCGGR